MAKKTETATVEATPEATATKKEAPPKDSLGCREGSQAAKINAAIGAKPKTAAAIAEETGLALGRVKSHLKFLVGKELVTETADGVALKKSKSK